METGEVVTSPVFFCHFFGKRGPDRGYPCLISQATTILFARFRLPRALGGSLSFGLVGQRLLNSRGASVLFCLISPSPIGSFLAWRSPLKRRNRLMRC